MGVSGTPVAGPVMLTFSPGWPMVVDTHFSSLNPSSVTTRAQFCTFPSLTALNVACAACDWPGGSFPRVQMRLPASTAAGGLERTYSSPSGMGLVSVIQRDSTLPELLTKTWYVASCPTPTTGGP